MAWQWLILVVIFYGILRYIMFRWKRKHLEEMIEKFSGPPSYPLIGNTHMFIGTSKEILRNTKQLFENYKSPTRYWLLHKPVVLIFDPENAQIVTNRTLDKGNGYKLMQVFLGEGLITCNGLKWKRNRRNLNPAFNVNILNGYFLDIFNQINKKLVVSLAEKADSGLEFDLWPYIVQCTSNTICMTAMHYRDEYLDESDEKKRVLEYGKIIERASNLVVQRMLKPWLHPSIFFKIYNRITGNHKIFEEAYKLPLKIIRRNQKEMRSGSDANRNICDSNGKHRNFIEILLKSEVFRNAPEKELVDEVVTFVMAGSETTAVTVCFCLLMLAMNTSCQERVYEELLSVLGDDSKPASLSELSRLSYMEQCIKETLRRFPSVPMITRDVKEDIILKDGKILPKGSTAVISILGMHLSPDVYEDYRDWDPDRFSPEEIQKRHPYSFSPFSIGPRSCIGAKYAMLATKAQLSTLLREYQFTTDMKMNEIKLGFDIVLRNNSGFKVHIKRRQTPVSSYHNERIP